MTALVAGLRGSAAGRLRALGLLAVALLLVAAATGSPQGSPALAVAALLLVLATVAAGRWPGRAAGAAIALVAVVPMYWGQPVIGRAIIAVPATVAAVVLAPAAFGVARRFRPVTIDVLFAGFIGFYALAAALNVSNGAGASIGLLWRFLLPYVVWRLFALRWLHWPVVAGALIASGALLGALAIQERRTGHNPFFTLGPLGYQAEQWAHSTYRFGGVRAEASFGEPISFSLFLAVCIVLAVTVVAVSRLLAVQVAAGAAAVVMGYAVLQTGSRAGVAAAVIGGAVQAVRLIPRVSVRRLVLVTAAVAAALVTTPLGTTAVSYLQSASPSVDSRESRSADYRLEVFSVLTDPSRYTLLGRPSDTAGGITDLAVESTGLKSLDNEYAGLLVVGGVLTLGCFVALGLTLLGDAIAGRGGSAYVRAVTSAVAALFVLLLTVSLLVQLADFFVLLLALLAAQRQRTREGDPA